MKLTKITHRSTALLALMGCVLALAVALTPLGSAPISQEPSLDACRFFKSAWRVYPSHYKGGSLTFLVSLPILIIAGFFNRPQRWIALLGLAGLALMASYMFRYEYIYFANCLPTLVKLSVFIWLATFIVMCLHQIIVPRPTPATT